MTALNTLVLRKNIILISVIISLLTLLAYYMYTLDLSIDLYYTIGWILVILVLLVLGNSLISRQFNRHLPWLKFGRRRLFTHLFLGLIYSLIVINLAYFTFKLVLTTQPPIIEQVIVMNVYGLVMFVPIFSIYFSLHFLKHWQNSAFETEKFKKETLKSQIDNLKNHLDPHFLFNNLNILSALIDKDANESKRFLDKFSDVYRALLKTKDEDLICLQDELDFIEAYIYLMKTRFEELIIFNINVEQDALLKMLPPLSIQLLIENVVKHNAISEKKPLVVELTSDGSSITVCNSLNLQKIPAESSGSGLDNIRSRYAYFTDRKVEINQSESQFCVTIPLIEVEEV